MYNLKYKFCVSGIQNKKLFSIAQFRMSFLERRWRLEEDDTEGRRRW